MRQAREEAAAAEAEAEEDGPDHETEQELFAARHAGRQGRATIVGTASYEHTLMRCERDLLAQTAQRSPPCSLRRVKTMSPAALLNRVKAIERAKGKHAVTKMRLFARVAFLEGYEEVSEAATDALARLVALLGDVGEEEEAGAEE